LARLISERPVFVNHADGTLASPAGLPPRAAQQNRFWTKIILESWVSGVLSNLEFAGFRDAMGRLSNLSYHAATRGSLKRRILA
jgi:hypothetical protein